jgi:hypothetical protein
LERVWVEIDGGRIDVLVDVRGGAAAGNARIYQRPGVQCVPVPGLPPSELAVARRRDDRRRPVLDLLAAAVAASAAPR